MKLTQNKGVDRVIMAGGGTETLGQAVTMVKAGGVIANINYHDSGENLQVPRLAWGCGMAHKTIKGGLCPGGRLRMEMLLNLVQHNRVDLSKLITHVFKGLNHIEEALFLMKDKPKDLIKPVVLIE